MANDGKVTIVVDVDGKKVEVLNKELDKTRRTGKETAKDAKELADSLDKTAQKAESASKGTQKLNEELGKTSKNSSSSSREVDKLGTELAEVSKNGQKTADDLSKTNDALDKTADKSEKAGRSMKDFAAGSVVFQVASKAINLVTQSLEQAISRFDTLQRFPRVMKSMGHSTDSVARSTEKLSQGIEGLPTTLDEVVGTAQRLTSITGDLDKSTDLTIALNNAFLASGASSMDASRGLQQYAQMLSAGKVDMQSWKTLQETMPYALQKTAESFGFAGASAQKDFYAALQSGEITFNQFADKLVKLNDGVGGFAELAKKNSEGIATSFGNLRNAIAKGVAGSIEAFDEFVKKLTGKNIAKNLDSLKYVINGTFKTLNATIKSSEPVAKLLGSSFKFLHSTVKPLNPAIIALVKGFIAFKVAKTAGMYFGLLSGKVKAYIASLALVKNYQTALNQNMKLFEGTLSMAGNGYALLRTQITLASVAQASMTTAVNAFKAAWATNPIGMVVAGVTMLISAFQWFDDKFGQGAYNRKVDKLTESTKEFVKESNKASAERQKGLKTVKAEGDEIEKLIEKTYDLTNAKGNTQNANNELKSSIGRLNSAVQGLDLSYNKKTKTLSKTKEEVLALVRAHQSEQKTALASSGLTDITKERAVAVAKLAEEEKKLAKARAEDSASRIGPYSQDAPISAAYKAHSDNVDSLKQKIKELSAEEKIYSELAIQAEKERSAAVAQAVASDTVSYEMLTETQQKVIDDMRSGYNELRDTVTNVFDAIEQKTALSADQMIENLQKNIEATVQWSDNLTKLAERGVSQGLIAQLEKMGPAAALQTQALVDASDEKLQELSAKYDEAGQTSKEAYLKGMKALGAEIPDAVKDVATETSKTLADQFNVENFAEYGQKVASTVATSITDNKQPAIDAAKTTGEEIKTNLTSGLEGFGLQEKATEGLGGLTSGLLGGLPGVQASAKSVGDSASNAIKESVNSVNTSQIGIDGAAGLTTGLNAGVGNVISAGKNLGSSTVGGIKTNLNSSLTLPIGRGAASGVAGGINAGKGSAIDAAGSLASSVKSNTAKASDGAHDVGYNVSQGVADGINSGVSSVINAAAGMAASAVQAAKSALGIHSPSRVMRDQVGKFIPQGVSVGIDKEASVVDESMRKLKESMMISTSPEIALGLNDSLSLQTTVRHVSKQSISEKIEVAFDKTAQYAEKALDVAEKAVSRPVNMIMDTGVLVGQIEEPLTRNQKNTAKIKDMMRGII